MTGETAMKVALAENDLRIETLRSATMIVEVLTRCESWDDGDKEIRATYDAALILLRKRYEEETLLSSREVDGSEPVPS